MRVFVREQIIGLRQLVADMVWHLLCFGKTWIWEINLDEVYRLRPTDL